MVGSVSEARAYLEGTPPFHDHRYFPAPDLIVSDMSLPGDTGNAFLAWLREDKRFAAVPLVFLSGTFKAPDQELAARLGAHDFLSKTGDIHEMTQRVQKILTFLPPQIPPTS